MFRKFLFLYSLSLVTLCCNTIEENTTNKLEDNTTSKSTDVLTESDISKIRYVEFELDQRVTKLVEAWEPYHRLENTIISVKAADFSYFKDNEVYSSELVEELRESLPDTLSTLSTNARLKILETMLYKTEDAVQLSNISKLELSVIVKDLLVSFSNLKLQLNKKIEKDSR